MEDLKKVFEEPQKEEQVLSPTGAKERETKTYGLPEELKEFYEEDLLKQYTEFHPEIPKEAIEASLEALGDKINHLTDEKKAEYIKSFQDTNKTKPERLKKLLKEGADYYDNSLYGKIKEAGGVEAFANKIYNDYLVLEEENKNLKNKTNTEDVAEYTDYTKIKEENAKLQKEVNNLKATRDGYVIFDLNFSEEVKQFLEQSRQQQ